MQFEIVGLLGNCDSFSFLTYTMPWMSIDVLGIHQQGEDTCPTGYCLHYGWSNEKLYVYTEYVLKYLRVVISNIMVINTI